MTVFGAISAAIARKITAFVGEVKKLVSAAKAEEKKLVTEAKDEISSILHTANAQVKLVEFRVEGGVATLKNDLIDKIAKI